MFTSKKASIVLLNYNGLKFNENCIKSILQQTYKYFEIVFVDNVSSDGSLEVVENIFYKEIKECKIKIIKNKNNEGFANGNNIGVSNADKNSKYICLLNNDTVVPSNWLEELVKGIELDNKLGAISGMILDKGYEDHILKVCLNDKKVFISTLFGELVTKNVSYNEIKTGLYYTSNLSGCCVLYKKDLIEQPFPSFYFAYAEDLFLGRLLLKKGYKLGLYTKSIVYHFGSGTFGKKPSNLKLFYGNRNQIINFLVFYKTSTILKLLPLFFITQVGHLFVNSPIERLLAKFKSWWRIFRNLDKIISLKRFIRKNTNITDKLFMTNLSYKLSEDIFYANFSKTKINIIKKINYFFRIYCNFFLKIDKIKN